MTLAAGTKLGPYEILSLLGVGGMGEVYKARDTRLDRMVAIKVLPSSVSSSPESRQRFEREARMISKLSHPHICALHDVGREGETEYLVMEYLEGETLADRVAKGALPLEQTLRYGAQIADALDKAHRQGIVHRDLKPGNVMLTKSGVKLLDFGLAKAIAAETTPPEMTSSPTAGERSALTQEGTLLGTLPYMAPEQLEGREADARTDVFALGATLYEMASGRKAFSGSGRASLASAILRDDPKPVSQIEAASPAALDRVIGRCLAKEPEQRWQSSADVRLELEWIARGGSDETPGLAAQGPPATFRRWLPGLAVLGVLAAALAAFFGLPRPAPPPRAAIRFAVRAPQGTRFSWVRTQNLFSVSPDGTRIAFVARNADGRESLWVRGLADPVASPIGGTEGAAAPFWSPDSRSLAFFADGKLKKIDARGGPAVTVCDSTPGFPSGSWGSRHAILFAALSDRAVRLVPEGGGVPKPVAQVDPAREEVAVTWPSFLPDGRHFLYVGRSEKEKRAYVRIGNVDDSKTQALLGDSSRAEYAPGEGRTGYLLFAREGSLFAQPFDAARLQLTGSALPTGLDIWEHVLIGSGPFSASNNGVLVSRGNGGPSRLVWLDRTGRETGSLDAPGGYDSVRLSPDSRRVAISRNDPRTGTHQIVVGDLSRQVLTPLDLDSNDYILPAWSPDGARLAFSVGSNRHPPTLYWMSLRGPGAPEPVIPPAGRQRLEDRSPDGRFLLFESFSTPGIAHSVIDLHEGSRVRLLIPGTTDEPAARFSPDGRWVAFCLTESGRSEVYITSFPEPGERIRVSVNGGLQPRWRRDGREIYYVSADNQMIATPVRLASDVQLGAPTVLFPMEPAGWRDYDVTADGSRFLAVLNVPVQDAEAISVTVNWPALLKR